MPIRTAQELVEAANAQIETLDAEKAKALLDSGAARFVDVREADELGQGRLPGAVHIPRGLLEFQADPTLPGFNPALAQQKLVVYCAVGGRSALAARTLKEMGYADVAHLAGGFKGWTGNGGPVEA